MNISSLGTEKNPVKGIIFDMDGVLLDTESLCKRIWRIVAENWGLKDPDPVYYKCVGQAVQDTLVLLQSYFEQQQKDFNARKWYDDTVELFHEVEQKEGLPKMKGADDCLSRLSKTNLLIAIASSTRTPTVKRQLTAAGIYDYFKTFTCGDTVEHSKPHPEIYLKACQSLGLKPEECVAVEDSPNGIRSAYSAGLKTIMIPDQIQPDKEILKMCSCVLKSLDELEP